MNELDAFDLLEEHLLPELVAYVVIYAYGDLQYAITNEDLPTVQLVHKHLYACTRIPAQDALACWSKAIERGSTMCQVITQV